ncbi:MAG: MFS transporter [Ferruginibacter sp.]|nr:MFS transporter [Ferruginibacter sp.]
MLLNLPIEMPRAHRIAVSTFFFIAGFCFASWASRIPDIKTFLQLSDGGLGAVLFALPVGLMVSMPLSGFFVSKFGSRKVLICAAVVYPVILVLLGFAVTPWQLAAILFLFGFCGNIMNISVNTQAVGVEALYGRSIMASFHGVWSLAGFSGAAVGALMVALRLAPQLHFAIIWVSCLFLAAITYKYILPQNTGKQSSRLFVKPDAAILKLGLIAFGCLVCEGTMFDWSGVYFQKVVKVPESQTPLGYVAFMSSMATGRFVADWLVTKFSVKPILQFSGLIIATGLLTSVIFPYAATAIIGFLLVGFGVSSVVPLVYGLAGKSNTMLPEMALAAVSTIGFLGFLVGPPLIGFLAEAAGLRWAFTVIACIGLGTTLLATKVKIG